ncbi:MAG: ferritin [Longimicrobiales bacterium]
MLASSDELTQSLNQQVGNEMGASMQYISIAAYFDILSLNGLARFFYAQANEERDHAMRFVQYLVDAGSELQIPVIPEAKTGFKSAKEAVAMALDWEKEVTQQIYGLVEIARTDKNFMAERFLDWFVNEQYEEVTTMGELLDVVERAGEDNLLAVEEYLTREGKVPPPPPGGE